LENPSHLEAGLRDALDHTGPAVIEVLTHRHELSIPPNVTLDQMRGFTLYTARSILSGRGDEIVQLAKTNLRAIEIE
jgi:pyruvate dehydrogenase (quinone)